MNFPPDDQHYGQEQLRTPPQNVDLEMAVLGGIMQAPQDAMPVLIGTLRRDDFYLDGHGIIWELMIELHERGIPPDAQVVIDELKSRGQLDRVGGFSMVSAMLRSVTSAAHVEHHAAKVSEKGKLRRMMRTCTELVDECFRQELSAEEVSNRMYAKALEYQVDGPEDNLASIRDADEEFHEAMKGPLPAIPSGYRQLDKAMGGGLAKGQLHTVLGLTSHGKTSFMLNMLMNQACGLGIPCLLFSVEMDNKQVYQRLVTAMTLHMDIIPYTSLDGYRGVNNYKMRVLKDGKLPDSEGQWMLDKAREQLLKAPIGIVDSGYMTPGRIRKAVLKYAKRHKDFVVFIDYYQILEADERGMRQLDKLQDASKMLRRLAKEIDMPVVCAAQLRRGFSGSRPMSGDVESCIQIAQDSYTCMVIDQPHLRNDKTKNTEITTLPADHRTIPTSFLYLDKNRNGQAGVMLQYHYVGPVTRFVELQPNASPDLQFNWMVDR